MNHALSSSDRASDATDPNDQGHYSNYKLQKKNRDAATSFLPPPKMIIDNWIEHSQLRQHEDHIFCPDRTGPKTAKNVANIGNSLKNSIPTDPYCIVHRNKITKIPEDIIELHPTESESTVDFRTYDEKDTDKKSYGTISIKNLKMNIVSETYPEISSELKDFTTKPQINDIKFTLQSSTNNMIYGSQDEYIYAISGGMFPQDPYVLKEHHKEQVELLHPTLMEKKQFEDYNVIDSNDENAKLPARTQLTLKNEHKIIPPPGLTLSAFRRPQDSVRLTNCSVGKNVHDSYDVHRILGYGATSIVRLAIRRRDGKKFAVKFIPKHVILHQRDILNEFCIMESLCHPNIVALEDAYETETEIQLVMEYCYGGDLFAALTTNAKRIKCQRTSSSECGFNEKQCALIISKVLDALCFIHANGIAHLDLKPENILLNSDCEGRVDIKISDFGTSRLLDPSLLPLSKTSSKFKNLRQSSAKNEVKRKRKPSNIGSNFYMAPEVSLGNQCDKSADMYSLGITMYIILHGHFPPISENKDLYGDFLSVQAIDLLNRLLESDPVARISAEEARRHEWIEKNFDSQTNWQEDLLESDDVVPKSKRRRTSVSLDIKVDPCMRRFGKSGLNTFDLNRRLSESDSSNFRVQRRSTCIV